MSASAARTGAPRHGADALASDAPASLARTRSFHTLDALRGVAALAVLLFHAAFFYGIKGPAEAQIAVDLFFVMSGFIIAYRYDGDLRRGMGLKAFAAARLARLYPLYLLGAVLGVFPALLAVAAGDGDWFHRGLAAAFPFHLLMLPTRFALPRIEELYPLNYVAWSLALEILINLAYAASFAFWTVRRLAALVVVAFVGLVFCVVHYGTLNVGFAWPHGPGGVARILYAFPLGVLLFRLFDRKPFAVRVPWWALLAASGALFVFDPPLGKPIWELFAVAGLVPLIVAAAVVNEPPKAARGMCALAGVFSYVLYSLHAPFIGLFLRGEQILHLDPHGQSIGRTLCFTLFLAALCIAAHVAYDRPVRRWLSRRRVSFAPRVPARAAASAVALVMGSPSPSTGRLTPPAPR